MGWRYEWLDTLPVTVHEVLVAMLTREQREHENEAE